MLIEKTTGTVFKNRFDAKKIMGTERYYQFVKNGDIEFIDITPFKD